MKYKLINENIKNRDILDIVYENRGINKEFVERLLNADESEYKNPMDIFGMEKAVNFFKEIIEKENLIVGLLVDEDVDGFTSSSLLYKWLVDDVKVSKENIRVFFHDKPKSHGLNNKIFDNMLNSDVELFIIADSSTNDVEQQQIFLDNNKQVIILDHHICDRELVEGIYLVNNQIGNSESKELSGVGIVIKFVKALGYDIEKYLDLVAVGLVADVMDLASLENRAIVNYGLSHLENDLIKEFFKNTKNPTIEDISWNLANFMNSVIRYGKTDEKRLLWDALIGEEGFVEYKKRDGSIVEQNYSEAFVRISGNVKSRQNNAIKKSVKELEQYIYKNRLENDKCIIIENYDLCEHSITGIVAQKLLGTFKRPIIIVSPYKNEMSGSVRSIQDFKGVLEESGLITFASGHNRAFGVGLPKENIPKLREYLNKKLLCTVETKIEEVDYIFDVKKLKLDDIIKIANLNSLWGNPIKEPTFIVKGITMESKDIKHQRSDKGYCTSFKYNKLTFKKNFSSQKVYEEMQVRDKLKFGKTHTIDLTLLVKFKQDKNGFYYISIEDFNSCKSSKVVF